MDRPYNKVNTGELMAMYERSLTRYLENPFNEANRNKLDDLTEELEARGESYPVHSLVGQ